MSQNSIPKPLATISTLTVNLAVCVADRGTGANLFKLA